MEKITYLDNKKEIFNCNEETRFYSYCIESLVTNNPELYYQKEILEFGSGDGTAVIKAIKSSEFKGIIHGFEINPKAVKKAKENIDKSDINNRYIIYSSSFFDVEIPKNALLISNPPYIPAYDDDLYMPELHGGIDGITLTKKLLELDFQHAMLLVSSYSNPIGLINHARKQGYHVSGFHITSMPFGYYSSEPKVMSRLKDMKEERMAFYSRNGYLLAGVLFSKGNDENDLSSELLMVLTSL